MIEPTEKDTNRRVIYKKDWMTPKDWEYGFITSFNDTLVHVRYGVDTGSKGTYREDLYWEFERKK